MMKKVIIDVDTGIDDALALSYAVRSSELHILGITTCFGNTSLEEATENTLKVLDVLHANIPVIPGAAKPLFRDHLKGKAAMVHGEDGLGNNPLPLSRRSRLNLHASEFIVSKIREMPRQVTLITLGGLTNLALAIMKDPEIIKLVERVVVMGGAVKFPGNVTPTAEANIYTDPEAAEYVFRSGIPITLVGLDVTMQTLLARDHLTTWRNKNTPLSRFLADITEFYINAYQQFYPDINGCALHDPLAVGAVIDPSFVKSIPMHVQVDVEGDLSIGRTIADLRAIPACGPNMDVCLEVDVEKFTAHFLSRVV
jgi:purine nucleosidase